VEATALLVAWRNGEEAALQQLLPLVHAELHQIARRCMAGERPGHTLQATALVHEAYLRLFDTRRVDWQDRSHFLAMAARLMRRILVDFARSKRAQKRGGLVERIAFDHDDPEWNSEALDLIDLDDALQALARLDARKARGVELRFFGGLSLDEIASLQQVSTQTVMRDWKFSKAFLLREIRGRTSAEQAAKASSV
jgi:RNA polymerase sigma factor (TIGR02999 family)